MSHKEIPAELISQLAAKMEEDPKIQAQLNALLGIHTPDPSNPAQKEAPLPSASPAAKSTPSTKKDVDAEDRPELEEASDMLALVPVVHLPRRVKYSHNFFIPNLTAMFAVLFQMDKYIIRKFKARRGAQLMCPIFNVLFFAEVVCYQVLRCLSFAGYLKDQEDQDFLDALTKRYPPEIIPIPGFLLPYFKAITTYLVQNKQFKRVSPDFPAQIKEITGSNDYHWINQNQGSQHFPIVPIILSVCRKFQAKLEESTAPTATYFKTDNWPLGKMSTTTPTSYVADINFDAVVYSRDTTGWTAFDKSALVSPGLRYPIVISKDIIAALHDGNISDYILPELTDMKKCKTYKQYMCMQDLTWFQSFLGPMSDYANLFNGSGTLADCSPDGPPTGAYIFTYSGKINPSTPLADGPITTLDSKGVFELVGKIRTTQEIEEPIPERMAALTHIHARLPTDHFFKSSNTAAQARNGNVWSQTPIYGPTVEHMELESFSGSCARYVKKVFNA